MARVTRMAARSLLLVGMLLAAAAPSEARRVVIPVSDAAVITNPQSAAEVRSLMRFELPEGLAGVTVEFAVVEFRAAVSGSGEAGVLTLDVFPMTREWSGDAVAWGEGWDTPGGDFDTTRHAVWTAAAGPSSVVRFDATEMVAGWVSGEHPNFGLLVRSAPGEAGTAQPADAGGERSGPALTVWYTKPDVGGDVHR
jgi:hypothetical protein